MAYPVDTAVETAIATIESVLSEDLLFVGNREAISLWRKLLVSIEARGASGYTALTQKSNANWIAQKNYGAS